MVTRMTRAEYEATFGVKPTLSKVGNFDVEPAPQLMTRDEYNAKFHPVVTQEDPRKLGGEESVNFKIGDAIINKSPIGIPFKQVESAKSGVERFAKGFGEIKQSMEPGTVKEKVSLLGRGIMNEIGGGLEAGFSPITGVISWGAGLPGVKQTVESIDKYIIQPKAEQLSESPYLQSIASAVPQDVAENTLILAMSLFGGAKSPKIKQAVTGGIREATYRVAGEPGGLAGPKGGLIPQAQNALEVFRQGKADAQVADLVGVIAAVENNYAAIRKAKKYTIGDDASLERIAKAHIETGLLRDIVDTSGKIDTAGAIKRYAAETVDGAEGVVRQNLALEGAVVNLAQIQREMIANIDPMFEGANLTTALNNIQKEIAGLRNRADEFGNIKLEKLQDAKIQTTSGIDYKKETTNAIKYKKLVAGTYKKIIEDQSKFRVKLGGKDYGVAEINKELAKFYTDMERLRMLGGKLVSGGRLGKSLAQLAGTGIGMAAGGILGPVGSAVGGVVGGEAARFIKGQGMASTFGGGGEGMLTKNPILMAAKAQGKKAPVIDLRIADKVVGTPKGVPKNKEIIQIEARIKKNVEQQKKAISDNDFTLVESLKAVYKALVGKLKDLIKKIKETPNRQGGFAKNPFAPKDVKVTPESVGKKMDFADREIAHRILNRKTLGTDLATDGFMKQMGIEKLPVKEQMSFLKEAVDYSYNLGNRNTQYNTTITNIKPSISPNATTLAQKIKATGEQKPTIKLKRDVTVTTLTGEKAVIDEGEVLKAYESGGKALLKDGREYVVSKSQYENIKNNSIKSEAKEFAPELKGTEETIKGASKWQGDRLIDNGEPKADVYVGENGKWHYRSDFVEESPAFKTRKEAMENAEADVMGLYSGNETKYSQYTLPGGTNYREILIKAPGGTKPMTLQEYTTEVNRVGIKDPIVIKEKYKNYLQEETGSDISKSQNFQSSHWDEPNVISHLRMNERTFNGKKVSFMEELQSDWAREGRSKGFINAESQQKFDTYVSELKKKYNYDESKGAGIMTKEYPITTEERIKYLDLHDAVKKSDGGIPNNPLLKNWQELSIKRALKEAVDNNAEYFAWINGDQTSARYNLSKQIDKVTWGTSKTMDVGPGGTKGVKLEPKDSANRIEFSIDNNGIIKSVEDGTPTDWKGKKLDEVIGKGLADKIMTDTSGKLSSEGLKFGGEWANTLYDKQVKNIVEDLTGGKVEVIDLGLPKEGKKITGFTLKSGDKAIALQKENLKVGQFISENGTSRGFVITGIIDGKFTAISTDSIKKIMDEPLSSNRLSSKQLSEKVLDFLKDKEERNSVVRNSETFDIFAKSVNQQALKLTPEIKAKIKGEAIKLK